MSFVPSLCLSCSRVTLLSVIEAQLGEVSCTVCGADARVVPGCSFSAADCEEFEELSEIVAHAGVKPIEAQRYTQETQRALGSGAFAQQLERLTTRMLGLLPVHIAAGKNFGAQRRILRKLHTIFEALATAQRGSAEYPVASNASRALADKS